MPAGIVRHAGFVRRNLDGTSAPHDTRHTAFCRWVNPVYAKAWQDPFQGGPVDAGKGSPSLERMKIWFVVSPVCPAESARKVKVYITNNTVALKGLFIDKTSAGRPLSPLNHEAWIKIFPCSCASEKMV